MPFGHRHPRGLSLTNLARLARVNAALYQDQLLVSEAIGELRINLVRFDRTEKSAILHLDETDLDKRVESMEI